MPIQAESHWPCSRCKKDRPRGEFPEFRWRSRKLRPIPCVTCKPPANTWQDEWKCAECGVVRNSKQFRARDYGKRKNSPITCKECLAPPPLSCTLCGKTQTTTQWGHRSRPGHATYAKCVECVPTMSASDRGKYSAGLLYASEEYVRKREARAQKDHIRHDYVFATQICGWNHERALSWIESGYAGWTGDRRSLIATVSSASKRQEVRL